MTESRYTFRFVDHLSTCLSGLRDGLGDALAGHGHAPGPHVLRTNQVAMTCGYTACLLAERVR